jgi:hypothetical protein
MFVRATDAHRMHQHHACDRLKCSKDGLSRACTHFTTHQVHYDASSGSMQEIKFDDGRRPEVIHSLKKNVNNFH